MCFGNTPIPIYTAADWGYLGPLSVMLASLDTHLPSGFITPVHVLTVPASAEKFTQHQWPAFKHIKLQFVSLDMQLLGSVPIYGHVGIMTYARLLLDMDKVSTAERALYLDADILIRGDMSPLLASVHSLSQPVAAVCDAGSLISDPCGVFNWRELGLPKDTPYFNAGILGLNLQEVRRLGLFERARAYLLEHGRKVISWDQGALNAVAAGRVMFWPQEWKYTTGMLKWSVRFKMALRDDRQRLEPSGAVIAHFTGSGFCKPWSMNSLSPFCQEYRDVARCVGFKTGLPNGLEAKCGKEWAKPLRAFHAFYLGFPFDAEMVVNPNSRHFCII
jgi:lipopolysaccharide biosynthesis glycosyltransferase